MQTEEGVVNELETRVAELKQRFKDKEYFGAVGDLLNIQLFAKRSAQDFLHLANETLTDEDVAAVRTSIATTKRYEVNS